MRGVAMRKWAKRRFEGALLRLAAWILDGNVARASVTSRRDNNYLFELPLDLVWIAERIEQGYPQGTPAQRDREDRGDG